jgi:hypothetical protein
MYIYLVTSYDKEDNPDFIADFTLFILWSEIEVNVGMIISCMPTWGPVIGRCRDALVRAGFSKWLLLSDTRTLHGTMNTKKDYEMTDRSSSSTSNLHRKTRDFWMPENGITWEATVATDTPPFQEPRNGRGDLEAQLNDSRGILARTEISSNTSDRPTPVSMNNV